MELSIVKNSLYGSCSIVNIKENDSDTGEKIKFNKVERKIDGGLYETIYENSLAVEEFTDYTCELGVKYIYQVSGENMAAPVEFNPVEVDYEDIILYDSSSSPLAIRLNPTLTNLKPNQGESITQTLGGKYPIIRQNGLMNYYTFTLGGMISLLANGSQTKYTNRTIEERKYRKNYLDILTNGRVKLFKAGPEGNMLIRLTGVTLSSESKLGRDIYSFSATATEVAAATIENMRRFNIFDPDEKYYIVAGSGTDGEEIYYTVKG